MVVIDEEERRLDEEIYQLEKKLGYFITRKRKREKSVSYRSSSSGAWDSSPRDADARQPKKIKYSDSLGQLMSSKKPYQDKPADVKRNAFEKEKSSTYASRSAQVYGKRESSEESTKSKKNTSRDTKVERRSSSRERRSIGKYGNDVYRNTAKPGHSNKIDHLENAERTESTEKQKQVNVERPSSSTVRRSDGKSSDKTNKGDQVTMKSDSPCSGELISSHDKISPRNYSSTVQHHAPGKNDSSNSKKSTKSNRKSDTFSQSFNNPELSTSMKTKHRDRKSLDSSYPEEMGKSREKSSVSNKVMHPFLGGKESNYDYSSSKESIRSAAKPDVKVVRPPSSKDKRAVGKSSIPMSMEKNKTRPLSEEMGSSYTKETPTSKKNSATVDAKLYSTAKPSADAKMATSSSSKDKSTIFPKSMKTNKSEPCSKQHSVKVDAESLFSSKDRQPSEKSSNDIHHKMDFPTFVCTRPSLPLTSKIDQLRHAEPKQGWINQLVNKPERTHLEKSEGAAAVINGDSVVQRKKEKLKDQFSSFLGFGEHLTAQLLNGMATPSPKEKNRKQHHKNNRTSDETRARVSVPTESTVLKSTQNITHDSKAPTKEEQQQHRNRQNPPKEKTILTHDDSKAAMEFRINEKRVEKDYNEQVEDWIQSFHRESLTGGKVVDLTSIKPKMDQVMIDLTE